MRTFHRVDEGRAKRPLPTQVQERLPLGQSMAVIIGLSVLSWGVVIFFVVAVRAIF
jgi:hypothetical protein